MGWNKVALELSHEASDVVPNACIGVRSTETGTGVGTGGGGHESTQQPILVGRK